MSEWVVRVDVDTRVPLDEEVLVALSKTAEAHNGFALTELGADLRAQLVDLRVTTPERFEAEALRPDFPPLASAADAAEILGVSRQRVHQLAASNTRNPGGGPTDRREARAVPGSRSRLSVPARPGIGNRSC
jgi:hypothetical protein